MSQFTIESGQNRKITIRYTPGDENAADTGSVEFTTNDPENANVAIPISVREDSPELIFRPSSLDFGRVAVGESKSLEVTLTNIGGFDLDVRDLKVVGRTDFDSEWEVKTYRLNSCQHLNYRSGRQCRGDGYIKPETASKKRSFHIVITVG